jgi:hypothetical protein
LVFHFKANGCPYRKSNPDVLAMEATKLRDRLNAADLDLLPAFWSTADWKIPVIEPAPSLKHGVGLLPDFLAQAGPLGREQFDNPLLRLATLDPYETQEAEFQRLFGSAD